MPSLAITEVAYLVRTRLGVGAELRFLADFADANYVAEPIAPQDWIRMIDLVAQYRDLPLGTVDASVVAAAERLGVCDVATTDRRHFNVVRPRHCESFTLLPES